MKVVLDANCAIEIALNKPEGDRLKALLDRSEQVLAPDLLIPEFVNALWKYHQFSQLSLSVCDQAMELLPVLVETFVPSAEIYREAFALVRAQQSRAAYDMFYLALARRENAVLLTLDATLKKEAKRAGIRVG
ncbi:MAG: type II toxin-antitoxin system VapC family toxin [Acidobacteriota bacterium]|nr:type II toxin-antitoxin system VapC family toxin [Acidobacteriota bacterium]